MYHYRACHHGTFACSGMANGSTPSSDHDLEKAIAQNDIDGLIELCELEETKVRQAAVGHREPLCIVLFSVAARSDAR